MPQKHIDLHGSAPDKHKITMMLIDVINHYVLVLVCIGCVDHISISPLSFQRTRATRDIRTHPEGHAWRPRLTEGMAQLHLLFFTCIKRHRLRNSLDNRFAFKVGGVAVVLARFQRHHADHQSSLAI